MREFAHEFMDQFFANFVNEFKYEIRTNSHEFFARKIGYVMNGLYCKQKNPIDSLGNPSRCAICESVYHWARDYPDKRKDPDNVEITLFCKEIEECYLESFLGESFSSVILDSGCSQTVCGGTWFKCCKDSLSNEDQNKIQESESNVDFKFGDGKVYRSICEESNNTSKYW